MEVNVASHWPGDKMAQSVRVVRQSEQSGTTMAADLGDLHAFVAVVRAGGFREAARASGGSASALSETLRRLEARLGVRLLNRTTRSVTPTEAGTRLLERLGPA